MMKQYFGKFFDNKGEFLGNGKFKKYDTNFKFKQKRFNVEMQNGSYYEVTTIPLILKKRYYFYNIDSPNPIKLDKKAEPILNSDLYNSIIESEEAKKLNNIGRKSIMDFLEPKYIIAILVIIAVGVYFLRGGSLT